VSFKIIHLRPVASFFGRCWRHRRVTTLLPLLFLAAPLADGGPCWVCRVRWDQMRVVSVVVDGRETLPDSTFVPPEPRGPLGPFVVCP